MQSASRSSRFRWGRVALAVVLGELLPILVLVLVVGVYSIVVRDADAQDRASFAQSAGLWVGPIAGALITLALSYWAGSGAPQVARRQGTLIGAAVALIDVAILAASGAAFRPLFLVSNLGKLAAGVLGGVLAARSVRGVVRGGAPAEMPQS